MTSAIELWETGEHQQYVLQSIYLLGHSGQTMQWFDEHTAKDGRRYVGWLEDVPTEEECPALLARAAELSDTAYHEWLWDNVESRKQLERDAAKLRRIVQIAKARERLGR